MQVAQELLYDHIEPTVREVRTLAVQHYSLAAHLKQLIECALSSACALARVPCVRCGPWRSAGALFHLMSWCSHAAGAALRQPLRADRREAAQVDSLGLACAPAVSAAQAKVSQRPRRRQRSRRQRRRGQGCRVRGQRRLQGPRQLPCKRGSNPQQEKGVAKSKRSSNKGGGSRGKSRASRAPTTQLDASWRVKADWPALVSTASSFDLDMPETILGSGEGGCVFGCRCGAPTHLLHRSIARCRDGVRCQQAPELNCQVLGHVPCEI